MLNQSIDLKKIINIIPEQVEDMEDYILQAIEFYKSSR